MKLQKEKINDLTGFVAHPIHNLYLCNPKTGAVVHKDYLTILKPRVNCTGYQSITVSSDDRTETEIAHRFVYECINGTIPKGYEIHHINGIKTDNRIENLQMLTCSENRKLSAKKRDYTFVKNNIKNAKMIEATDENKNKSYYKSIYACSTKHNINPGIIKYCCEKKNKVKGGYSKINGTYYTFQYVTQIPEGVELCKSTGRIKKEIKEN